MLLRVLDFEWGKWKARKESWWTIGFLIVATLGYGALSYFLQQSSLTPIVPGLNTGEGSGFHLAFRTASTVYRVLGLFLLLWGSASLAGEIEKGTLRTPLLRLPRRAFPLGKAAFLGLVGAASALVILALALTVGAASYGLGPIHIGKVLAFSTGELMGAGLLAGVLALLPLASALSLGICFSSLMNSTAGAQSMALIVGTVLLAASLLPESHLYLFPSTAGWPFAVAINKAGGMKDMAFGGRVLSHVGVNLVWIVGLLAVATLRFEKRDLR